MEDQESYVKKDNKKNTAYNNNKNKLDQGLRKLYNCTTTV